MTPTQEDVLARKGHALRSGLGLQIWGDPFPDSPSSGDASQGTAERQARILRAARGPADDLDTPASSDAGSQGRRDDLDTLVLRLTRGAGRLEPESPPPPAPRLRRVLVGVDGSDGSRHALAWARALHDALGVDVILAHVALPLEYHAYYAGLDTPGLSATPLAEASYARELRQRDRILDEARESLDADVPRVEALHLEGHAGMELVRAARTREADLVIVGAHARVLDRLLLGSVSDHVKNHAPCSVLLAKGPPEPGDVLVPVDGSAASRYAARLAYALARAWGREATLLHVIPPRWYATYDAPLPHPPRAEDAPRVEGVRTDVQVSEPSVRIVDVARETRPSLVVMGSRGLTGLQRLLLGSVSNHVAHRSPASVLLAHPPVVA